MFLFLVLVKYNNPGVWYFRYFQSCMYRFCFCDWRNLSKLLSLHYNHVSEITSKNIGLTCYHTFSFSSNIVGVADVHVDCGVSISMKTTWCLLIEQWCTSCDFINFLFSVWPLFILIRYRSHVESEDLSSYSCVKHFPIILMISNQETHRVYLCLCVFTVKWL